MSQKDTERDQRGADVVYETLVNTGVELLVGLPGTQTLPLDRTVVEREEIEYLMARHETAIPHIAWGYYEATGRPAATLTVPGPGDTNVMHGLKNAYEDCVPIFHISADTNPEDHGKKPIHEIEHDTFDNVVKCNATVQSELDLSSVVGGAVETALTPPYGPVRLGVPSDLLDSEVDVPAVTVEPKRISYDNEHRYEEAASLLREAERPVIYAGGGARRSTEGPRVVREFAEQLNAPVVTSYKGKGVFPEDDPKWLGVTGSHLPEEAHSVLDAADVVLAFGTDFDGVTTNQWELPLGETLIHVTLDSASTNVAYEADVTLLSDVTAAGDTLLNRLDERTQTGWDGEAIAAEVRDEYKSHLHDLGLFDGGTPVNTPELLETVRRVTPRDSVVTTDVGGFRLWAMQTLETSAPEKFITAGSWAGMGVGLPAAIGAVAGHEDDQPVICLTGDGGLLMCIHELHTAAEYGLNIVIVVANNQDYGIISKSPEISEHTESHAFGWAAPDFATIATGFGVDGVRAKTAEKVGEALEKAITDRNGPVLVDVPVETTEPSAVEASRYESSLDLH